ncbi:MAG: GGDEF domain-containing protein [Solirubrobacteraceae bacterium]|nr:GGDEF domain-containing protein [Solirubrobacteraceae bacterium]
MFSRFPKHHQSPVPPPAADLTPERGSILRWRRFAILMLLAGAAGIEAVLAVGSVTTDQPVLVHGAAGWLVALALILALQRGNSFLGVTRLVIGSTILAITALVAAIDGVEMVALFFMWPLLGAAYLLSRMELAVATVLTACGYAFGLLARDEPGGFPWVDYVLALTVALAIIAVVRALAENLGTTIDSLRHTSTTDPLTGLLNRRGFQRRLSRHYDRAVVDDRPITALLIDIDHFKRINDEHGHPVGDRALTRFTELLGASCRASDLVARVGGEEFAVVMPGATLEQAIARAEQFCAILRDDRAINGVQMTASVGVAARQGLEGWEAMLAAADAAVYEAKRTGRDRIVTSDSTAVV